MSIDGELASEFARIDFEEKRKERIKRQLDILGLSNLPYITSENPALKIILSHTMAEIDSWLDEKEME